MHILKGYIYLEDTEVKNCKKNMCGTNVMRSKYNIFYDNRVLYIDKMYNTLLYRYLINAFLRDMAQIHLWYFFLIINYILKEQNFKSHIHK